LSVSQSRASTTCWITVAVASAEWKWKEIAMDFIMGLPRTQSSYDFIWVIVDGLTKIAHFIPVKTTYWTTTSKVVHGKDSLSAWSAEEDCV
jgi:hypothetical protein